MKVRISEFDGSPASGYAENDRIYGKSRVSEGRAGRKRSF